MLSCFRRAGAADTAPKAFEQFGASIAVGGQAKFQLRRLHGRARASADLAINFAVEEAALVEQALQLLALLVGEFLNGWLPLFIGRRPVEARREMRGRDAVVSDWFHFG